MCKVKILTALAALLLAVHVINGQLDGAWLQFGVIPRRWDAWPNLLSAPFLHLTFAHLFSNLVPLLVLSALCLMRSIAFYLWSSLFIILLSGVLVWVFAREASHVGASGWVFGLWSLTIAMAWFDRRFKNLIVAAIVLFAYGSMAYGLLPVSPGVSFESHLFGAFAGIVAAFLSVTIDRRARAH